LTSKSTRVCSIPLATTATTTTKPQVDDNNNHQHNLYTAESQDHDDDELDAAIHDDDDDDRFIADIVPCETYLAIQSLQQSIETCLSIPIFVATNQSTRLVRTDDPKTIQQPVQQFQPSATSTTTPATTIRAVLECQLMEWFQSPRQSSGRGWSTRMVQEQLQQLRHKNMIRSMRINGSNPNVVYVTTNDYIRYIRTTVGNEYHPNTTTTGSNEQNLIMLEWWIRYLSQHTGYMLHVVDIEHAWNMEPPRRSTATVQYPTHTPIRTTAADLMKWLQHHQFLLSASVDHTTFQLWLPGWSTVVLPALMKQTKDALLYIQRSFYKERSVQSIIQRISNSTSIIPIEHVLISYMVANGHVRRIQRPTGMFLKLNLAP
jgi:hypothetical protein